MNQIYSKIGFTISSAFLTLIIGLFFIQFGGVIDVAGGAGFDGIIYEAQVKEFETLMAEGRINSADIIKGQPAKPDRFVPSMLIHYGMKWLNIPMEKPQIVKAFQYHNMIWLVLAALAWGGIATRFKLKDKNKWFGWVMFFLSWATLKMPYFDPVLTDTMALCLALILLFFFFQHDFIAIIGILICGFVGAFVWKPILIYAYILLLFPYSAKTIIKPTNWINLSVKIIPSAAFMIAFLHIYLFSGGSSYFKTLNNGAGGMYPFMTDWLFVSLITGVTVTFCYFYFLYRDTSYKNLFYVFTPHPKEKFNPLQSVIQILKRVLPVVILFFAVKYVHGAISEVGVSEQSTDAVKGVATSLFTAPISFLKTFFYSNYVFHAPLEFMVAHAVYFGIWWVIVIVFFPQIAEQIREKGGVGIILIYTASLANSIFNPQSRIGTALMPFIFIFVIFMIDKNNWDKKYLTVLGVIGIIASKFWMPIGAMLELVYQNGQIVGQKKGIGWDAFFMQIGMQMPPKWYVIYGIMFIILVGWLFYERHTLLNIQKVSNTNQQANKKKRN